jgi:hypothetical protein
MDSYVSDELNFPKPEPRFSRSIEADRTEIAAQCGGQVNVSS